MIVYEPNKNWFKDVGHLFKSWTMQKIIRACIAMAIFSTGLSFALEYMPKDIQQALLMDTTVFSFLGVVLSILLVFRTNTAYDRWWEGRKQWGALVNNCRNLAIEVHATFPREDKETRHYMAVHISNFCIAFKEHLRDGTKTEELISVSKEELEVYNSKGHIPNHIAYELYNKMQDGVRDGKISPEDMINIKPQLQSLLDILGACERIKKTPIPFSYAVYIKIFISVYALLLPFALFNFFGLFTGAVVAFIFFAFLGLELMAEEIEGPFGLDCNDLPTGTIAHTIKDNVFEILEARASHTAQPELYQKIF